MSDSKPPINLPADVWTNIYEAANVTVGNRVTLYLHTGSATALAIKATEPTNELAGVMKLGAWLQIDAGESGLWAKPVVDSTITVQEG